MMGQRSAPPEFGYAAARPKPLAQRFDATLSRVEPTCGFALFLRGDTLRRVILWAPSAPAVQIFIPTMRAFDRGQLIIECRHR
jgi:hypothetical protein